MFHFGIWEISPPRRGNFNVLAIWAHCIEVWHKSYTDPSAYHLFHVRSITALFAYPGKRFNIIWMSCYVTLLRWKDQSFMTSYHIWKFHFIPLPCTLLLSNKINNLRLRRDRLWSVIYYFNAPYFRIVVKPHCRLM